MKTYTQEEKTALFNAILDLNLDPIKIQLMDEQKWSREYADEIEQGYKRYLFLSVTQDFSVVPTKEIDEFWHTHILDSRKYFEDCEKVFGFYIHHFPYFGMRDEEDAHALRAAFEETKRIWQTVFGEPLKFSTETVDRQIAGQCCGANCCVSPDNIRNFTHRPHIRPSFKDVAVAA